MFCFVFQVERETIMTTLEHHSFVAITYHHHLCWMKVFFAYLALYSCDGLESDVLTHCRFRQP